jgi:hypothetical protein
MPSSKTEMRKRPAACSFVEVTAEHNIAAISLEVLIYDYSRNTIL